jgi:hypothetical protein
MKKRLVFIFMAAFSLFIFSNKISAQGIYSEKADTESSEEGSLRNLPSDESLKGKDPGQQVENNPVGEGVLILSVLAGGYALVRKRRMSKNARI